MCEFTIPGSGTGERKHRYRNEPVCVKCKTAAAEYRRGLRRGIMADGHGREYGWFLWKNYRIRRPEYDAILDRQNGVCAVCDGPFKPGSMDLDHNHACDHPGKGKRSCADCVRGILCRRCNLALPVLDDAEWLKRAVAYLGNEHTAEILRESRLF